MGKGVHTVELNRFLAGVEQSAFQITRAAVWDTDEALDIVQEAMFTLPRKYASKPEVEWRPLFFRILQNRIRDWHRRSAVRGRVLQESEHDGVDRIEQATDDGRGNPAQMVTRDDARDVIRQTVATLPARQQQAFLLRAIEGMNVAETAHAMRCSQGSVKTHYSRALAVLREALGEHWE